MQIKNRLFSGKRFKLKGTLGALSALLISTGVAQAQSQPEVFIDYSHPNITVDLSVLGDGGYTAAPVSAAAPALGVPSGRKLLVPGGKAPQSMLHVPMASGETMPQLKQPVMKAVVKPPVQKVEAAPAPTAAPEPAPVIAQAPEPEAPPAAPQAVVTKAPEELKVPEKPVEVAKIDKKAPPPAPAVAPAPKVEEKKETVAPTPPPTPESQAPEKPEVASLPSSGDAVMPDQGVRVIFGAEQTKLPESSKAQLVELANSMKGKGDMRLQLMAYAGGPDLSSSLARRMSLSRALSIRSFLIENGVRSTRIDVRALGNKTNEEPVNRVDLNVSER